MSAPTPEQLVATVEAAGRQAEERLAKYQDMQNEIRQLEITTTSPDRSVTVVAGPNGSIKDLRLTDNALRMSAQTLSRAVLSTLQTASAESARRMAEIVQYYAGDQVNLVERVAATQEAVFGKQGETVAQENSPRVNDEDAPHVLGRPNTPPPGPASTTRPSSPPSKGNDYLRLYGGDDE